MRLPGALAARDDEARELMDDPLCDPTVLERTYARFRLVNAIVSRQRAVYRRWIRPRLSPDRPLRVLDIGTGGADFPRRLLDWAARERGRLDVLAIDADERAVDFARRTSVPRGLRLAQALSSDLRAAGEQFDVVVSNHLLHHLDAAEVRALLDDSYALLAPRGLAIHTDIERSSAAYVAFATATAPFARNLLRDTFIRPDGLTSIRRARTAAELASLAGPDSQVRRSVPWRVELVRERG